MWKPEAKVISTITDAKDRPLIVLRRTNKGKLMYVLMRYNDMTEEDRDKVRSAYELAKESGQSMDSADATAVDDIESFLSFKDDEPCG